MNPRALPPVTQSSALQAPERMWGTCDVIALQVPECLRRPIRGRTETSRGQGFILVYRLAMDAKTRKGDDVAD